MYKKICFCILSFVVLSALLFSGCQSSAQGEKTGSDGWYPDDSEPWNFTPTFGNLGEDTDQYDFEITLESTVYAGTPEFISYTLVNKTGESFYTCGEFIEKAYEAGFPPYYDEVSAAWIRIPFYRTPIWGYCPNSRVEGKIELAKYLKEDYTFTPGNYRLVIFLNDGPHYVYFKITEA